MAVSWSKACFFIGRLLVLSATIVIIACSSLEIIFSPILTFKYFVPSLARHGIITTDNLALSFFYMVCIAIQVANFLGSLALFVSMLLTGYNEKWFAYDMLGLLSVTASLSLVTHRELTGIDYYGTVVEKDIYYQTAKIGDVRCTRKACYHTDVYVWHQNSQCCGWHSASELAGLSTKDFAHSGNHSADKQLPQFCCLPDSSLVRIGDKVLLKGFSPLSEPCVINSPSRFRSTCSDNRASFFELRSVSMVSHPTSLVYACLKLFTVLGYAFLKKHYFVPLAEGIYSYEMSA